jgi:hypothetical protein
MSSRVSPYCCKGGRKGCKLPGHSTFVMILCWLRLGERFETFFHAVRQGEKTNRKSFWILFDFEEKDFRAEQNKEKMRWVIWGSGSWAKKELGCGAGPRGEKSSGQEEN